MRRRQRERDRRDSTASPNGKGWSIRSLEVIGHLAQIALAVVAIFGYFYTVQPIYQKERLAEQVAQYEGIIKEQAPKVAAMETQLASLQRERQQLSAQLQHEREQLSAELKSIERQLSAAREEKNKIENQIQFMTYKYRLPDGRPAVTAEQVKIAQEADLKRSFFSYLSLECMYRYADDAFPTGYVKRDAKSKFFPFSEKELTVWKEQNTKYPLKRAIQCIDQKASEYSKQYGQHYSGVIEGFRAEAIQQANAAAAKQQWVAPLDPPAIVQELATKRAAVEMERLAALKKVEDEYGDWENTFGESRRTIFKHNYLVGKQNAETMARGALFNLEWEYQKKADDFRKSIGTEIERLLGKVAR